MNQTLSPLYALSHLILTITLHGRRGEPYYTGVETEAQREGRNLGQGLRAGEI